MAFPVVQTRTTGSANAAALVVVIPSGHVLDDLIFILLKASTTTTSWSLTSGTTGWQQLADQNGLAMFHKQIGASEADPSFDLSASERSGYSALRIDTQVDSSIQFPERSTQATGTSIGPNPPALAPTGGAKDYLWIAVAGYGDGRATFSSAPASYTNLNAVNTGGAASGISCATAERQFNTSSENPAAFTSARSDFWQSYVVAVHPVPPAGAIGVHLTQSFFLTGNLRKLVG